MTIRSPAPASSAIAQPIPAVAPRAQRDGGLDALRAATVLLVVFHHTAITYGGLGSWFYREAPADRTPGTMLLTLFVTVNQAYFMGLLFLLAGYFTPGSLARRGAWHYAKERLLRLGVPMLVFGFVLGPFTAALALTATGRPFSATLLTLWGRGAFQIGPLWFALALLVFSFAFMAWKGLAPRVNAQPRATKPRPFPSNPTLAIAALATGAAAFALRLHWPVGTDIGLGLQLGYFTGYVVLFAAGCIAASSQWLSHVPTHQRRAWLILAWIALPIFFVLVSVSARVPALQGNPLGGWNVPAAAYAFWEPIVAFGFIMGLLHAFGRRFSRLGPIWAALTRRSYAIYVIHPPVLVGVALAWRDVPAPPLIKFALTGMAASLACFLIAGLLLRVPVLRRIL